MCPYESQATDEELLKMGYTENHIKEFHIIDFYLKSKSTGTMQRIVHALAKHRYRSDNWHDPITRQILTEKTGVKPRSMSRALTRLKNEKVIEIHKWSSGPDTIKFTDDFIKKTE